ncbi:hypothetical protein [Catenulispora subtropica]|uniref:ABM domain-containing protein n=1 Tax=Catenulispora subtropica TaxID=450798 RepID=A0ABN2QMZ4_9ACTN
MFVRTMYITTDPADVGPALDVIVKAVPGMIAEQTGFHGIGIFADRTLGKILTGSWWESEQAQMDSDAQLRDRRIEMLAPVISTITTMSLEAVAYTRPTPGPAAGAGFRLQRMMFDPAQADRIISTFQEAGLPQLEALDGFRGGSMLMDRARGMASVGVIYRDMDALAASRGPQAAVRKAAFARMPGVAQLIALEEMEVVEMDVPTPSA